MAFEWFKIYKWENALECQINEIVYDYLYQYYGISNVSDLTPEQMKEIDVWLEDRVYGLSPNSPMRWGFNNFKNEWEDSQ